MKQNDVVMTPHGKAKVTEVHSGSKTVKVEMLGNMVNGTMTWPKPLIRVYSTKFISEVKNS